jgi:hypothetical protein
MGTLERRVLPTARRFRELGISSRHDIAVVRSVEGDPLRVGAGAAEEEALAP